ncbi:hypothetical protein Tsubulata_035104 [Turnera subulata]|uniref:non-specific serine/threonine protein kinase n=1 Tax=Turnera subulata TaxID=218843 RepID=A0A9Q0FAT0_9ROSI|nr:hypothetical protein Tsubulata_035104 [Turnera subulata]
MTKLPLLPPFPTVFAAFIITFLSVSLPSHALGSGSTLAVISATATVCGVAAYDSNQSITCYSARTGRTVAVQPSISFSAIAGGDDFFCGLRSGGYAFLCWNTFDPSAFVPQRVYVSNDVFLQTLSVGDRQVCATVNDTRWPNNTGTVNCWRGDNATGNRPVTGRFGPISSGFGFSCGILTGSNRVRCWGSNESLAIRIESGFGNMEMVSVEAGGSHVCGVNSTGFLVCRGDNSYGQLNIPDNNALQYRQVALGADYSCAIRRNNGSVVCWGGRGGGFSSSEVKGVFFESIVAGSNFTCGLVSRDFSVMCWGPGWPNSGNVSAQVIPVGTVLPGPCVPSSCSECGIYGDSENLCSGSGWNICKPCDFNASVIPPVQPPSGSPPPPTPSRRRALTTGLLVFAIIGSVGALSGIGTVIYCLWTGVCFGKKKVHNSVQPTITRNGSNGVGVTSNHSGGIVSRSSTIRRQGSRLMMRRQRSGTSSKHTDRAEEFTLAELAAATDGFSLENKIGAGSFVPQIMCSELAKILDPRVGPLELNEAEAVELVAYTAMHCVHLEGKDRPTMTDIVANLERALSLCEGSHGSISSGTISIISD